MAPTRLSGGAEFDVSRPPDARRTQLASPRPSAASPSDASGREGVAPLVLGLQSRAGNAAIASLVGHPPTVQRMDVQIDEVVSDVRVADQSSAQLSPELLARIVQTVLAAVREREAGGARAASNRRTEAASGESGGSPDTAPTEAGGQSAPAEDVYEEQ